MNPDFQNTSGRPFVVALTGGIASGKSLVSREFEKLGVPVIDTDIIAREVVQPGMPALEEISQTFGEEILDKTGRLKRSKLRSLIFSDSVAREKLESILHPRIRQAAMKAIARVDGAYCLLVIPLLTEKGAYPNTDRILVVDTNVETQVERLMRRDHCSREEAQKALDAQASREQRLKLADDVLDNSGSAEAIHEKVASLHRKYLELAAQVG